MYDFTKKGATEYFNAETGEITNIHSEAMKWYRDGDSVEVTSPSKPNLTVIWVH